MFRDLKEYQEIAKIYAEKVSKVSEPENLDERSRRNPSGLSPEQKKANQKGFLNRILFGNPEGKRAKPSNRRADAAKKRREMQNKKPEKKMSNIPVIDGPVNNPEYGKNMSRDAKDLNPETKADPKPKSKFIKRERGKGPGFYRRGTPQAQRAENQERQRERTKEMFKKRQEAKAAGKPQMSGKERAQAMAKARLAKKAEMAKEDYTPYDIVLDYLLASEQAATIEEANYIMTEMDAETIQSIVAE